MTRRALTLLVLLAINMAAALFVVQAKNDSRGLQGDLQKLRVQRDGLKTEWAQLQLEESAWANPDRVARIAHKRLDMVQPRTYTVLGDKPRAADGSVFGDEQ